MKRSCLLCLPLLCVTLSYQTPSFNEQAEIAAAQAWYQSNHANAAFLGQALQPDWSAAQVVKPKNDRLLIDVPLIGGNQYTYSTRNPATGQPSNEVRHGATRLVITKFGENHYVPLLLHIFGAPAFTNQYGQAAVASIRPHNIPSNFTGHMVYTRLDGTAFYGLYIENGQAIHTLTAGEYDNVVPRFCITVESITVYWEGSSWTTYYVECYVFEGGGGYPITLDGGWLDVGPVEECYDCLPGGGFLPPLCPDGNLMPESGGCLCSDGSPMPSNGACPEGPCKLTNTYVIVPGPSADGEFVGPLILPWYAFSNVAAMLTDCQTGTATFNTMLAAHGTTLGTLEITEAHNLLLGYQNFPNSKKWRLNVRSSATFRVTVVTMFGTITESKYAEEDLTFFMPYN